MKRSVYSDIAELNRGQELLDRVDVPLMAIRASVQRSTNQSIPSGIPTVVSFNTEHYDTYDLWSIFLPTRFRVINAKGLYLVTACVQWEPDGNGFRRIFFRKDGLTIIGAANQMAVTSGGDQTEQSLTVQWRVDTIPAYVELFVEQNSGGNLNILNNSVFSPAMTIVRIA